MKGASPQAGAWSLEYDSAIAELPGGSVRHTKLPLVVTALCLGGLSTFAQQAARGPEVSPPSVRSISADVLSGDWDYNAALSVDAATGRPEQAPRSAARRPVTPEAAPATASGSTSAGSNRSGRTTTGGSEADRAMYAALVAERRALVRDLLEVPERLTIRASAAEVTFIDDLNRERTFTADGRTQKYQIGAAKFDARAAWHETYFRKDIEGPNGFRMSEAYFLGDDGNRLYVIVRIGDPKKPETLAGINRVYDRIDDRFRR